MAFADPQSVTINAVAQSLPRISSGQSSGVFSKDDATVKLSVSHQVGKRARRSIRLDFNKIAPDVFNTASNLRQAMSVSLAVDVPLTGFTVTEQKQIVDALTAYLTAGSGSKVTQLLGGEN